MPDLPLNLSAPELVARLTQTEDAFVERKGQTDRSAWLRTVVAFANSVPIGLPAVLFIGVNDDGTIQDGMNVEKTLQQFSDFVGQHAWPPIYTLPRALTHQDRSCVAVIVPGSAERPHFAGRAYIREGTQTKDGSPSQFAELIAVHTSKGRTIGQFIGKAVTYSNSAGDHDAVVLACTAHYISFRVRENPPQSTPLAWIEIDYDHPRERLRIRADRS